MTPPAVRSPGLRASVGPLPDAEVRGVTTVDERAVRRIAARAAREVPGIGPEIRVNARIVGDAATLDVRLPVHYPLPIGRTAEACREHLIRRTEELSGLTVPRVDIEVTALPATPVEGRIG